MREIMIKELRLSASALSYVFIAFGLMFFVPGYPILCGVFFVTLGIFQSFQSAREANDILFSALLPFAKRDVVKGKYLFVCFIELCALLVMGIAVIIRMTILSGSAVYRSNALMNANPFALGMAFLIFALFNAIFVGGFFKTAYKFSRPFVAYMRRSRRGAASFPRPRSAERLWDGLPAASACAACSRHPRLRAHHVALVQKSLPEL